MAALWDILQIYTSLNVLRVLKDVIPAQLLTRVNYVSLVGVWLIVNCVHPACLLPNVPRVVPYFTATTLGNVRLAVLFAALVLTAPRMAVCRVIQRLIGLCYTSTPA